MSLTVETELLSIQISKSNQGEKVECYKTLLDRICQQEDQLTGLRLFLPACLSEDTGITISRLVLTHFIQKLGSIDSIDCKKNAGVFALELIQPRVISFEEQDTELRICLADLLETEGDNAGAAKILAGIQLDSSQRKISDKEKLETWIRIVRNFLEDDDTVNAEAYLNRAKSVIHEVNDTVLGLHFQLCQARILDSQRYFLQACTQYHNLSQTAVIDDAERSRCLSAAITCAVLAPAGPMRSRALARLYKDENAVGLNADYSILEKMYMDRVISSVEIMNFATRLAPHHMAEAADGTTVLAKAMIEHNMLGVSRLYADISFAQLGKLLGLSDANAEGCAARMIEQGRLVGRIDQMHGRLYFHRLESSNDQAKARSGLLGASIRKWDIHIQSLMDELERIASSIQIAHPDFYRDPKGSRK